MTAATRCLLLTSLLAASLARAAEPEPAEVRMTSLKYHPLPTIIGIVGGFTSANTSLIVPVEMEHAILPNLSLYGIVTPGMLSTRRGLIWGLGGDVGARVYLGRALDGAWAGVQVGAGVVVGDASAAAVDAQLQAGYQWILPNGLTFGASLGLSAARLASGQFPLTILVPVGTSW